MWEPKTYEPSRFDDVVEMSVENYGIENDICDPCFLKHLYFDNPSGDALIELAVDPENNVLAGQYIVQPTKIRFFGRELKAAVSLNTLTREKYRGQKIFVKLAERTYQRAEQEGFSFVYGAPNPNSYPGFMRKLAFRDIHHFPLYVRPISISKMLRERNVCKVAALITSPLQLFFHTKVKNSIGIVELDESNVQHMDAFWDKVKDKYPIMGIRDSEYIKYRYLNVPRRTYYPLMAISDGVTVAFAVGRIREVAGFKTGMIADFLFLPGYESEAKRLINVLVKKMKDDGASLAACVILSHTGESKILRKSGFFRVPERLLPQPTPLIFRLLDKKQDESKMTDIENWFFTTGDYDVV